MALKYRCSSICHRAASLDLKERIKNHRWFAPAFGIVASQGVSGSAPLLRRLLESLPKQHERLAQGEIILSSFQVTGKNKAVIRASAGSSDVIIKLPFSDNGRESEENNSRILNAIHAKGGSAEVSIPEPLASGSFQSVPYFVETCCPGDRLAQFLGGVDRAVLAEKVFALWRNLLEIAGGSQVMRFDGELFERYVTGPAKKVRPGVASGKNRWTDR